MTARRNFWVRWRVPLSYPLALISFWLAKPTRESLLAGAGIAAVGLIVRGAAAGILHKGEVLATSGIYAWTRNPLYLGSTVMAVGFGMAAHSWVVAGVILAYFAVFYPVVVRNEEAVLREKFGAEFDAYTARVSAFLPWPSAQPTRTPGYSWAQFLRNHEYRATVGVALAIGLLAVRMYIRK